MSRQFICNLCGQQTELAAHDTFEREAGSCLHCHSFVRLRGMTHLMSMVLHAKSLAVADWPEVPGLTVIGVSEWAGYTAPYSKKFNYTNTQFHEPPFLDIKTPGPDYLASADIVSCSEVLEHVTAPVADAITGLYNILKPGGTLLLTVPWTFESTKEHFSGLADWRLEKQENGEYILINQKPDGTVETYHDLIFHGGPGTTLEMRVFGINDLITLLLRAGFRQIRIANDVVPQFGIDWKYAWSLPIIAVRPSFKAGYE
jgi:hypothetical protein